MSEILRFLSGDGVNRAGERHADVLRLGDLALEQRHDFIQWLFPLTERSAAVPGSPVLTELDVAAIQSSDAAKRALAAAADRMGRFYDDTAHWLVPRDHNHLRITRIIRSLRLLSGDAAAAAFRARILAHIAQARAPISATSRDYWMRA